MRLMLIFFLSCSGILASAQLPLDVFACPRKPSSDLYIVSSMFSNHVVSG